MSRAHRDSWLHPCIPVLILVGTGLLVAFSVGTSRDGAVPGAVAACASPVRR